MPLHVVYFENSSGVISLPPTSDTPTPSGYIRKEANTIYEVAALEKRMQRDSVDRAEQECERDEALFMEKRREIRRKIMARMESVDTDLQTKEFLRGWCQLRDETRRQKYADIIHQRLSYFELLNFDKPRNAEELLGESL
jgi:hypothetical protein